MQQRVLPPLRLYLDDVDDLVAVMRDRSDGVRLLAGDAESETCEAEDLRSATRAELKHLRLVSQSPRVQVCLGRQHAHARTYEVDRPDARALVDDLWRLLRQRRSYLTLIFVRPPIYVLAVLLALSPLFFTYDEVDTRVNQLSLLLGICIWSLILGLSIFLAVKQGFVFVVLDRRSDRRVLSASTVRQVVVALVTGLIVASVSVLLTVRFA